MRANSYRDHTDRSQLIDPDKYFDDALSDESIDLFGDFESEFASDSNIIVKSGDQEQNDSGELIDSFFGKPVSRKRGRPKGSTKKSRQEGSPQGKELLSGSGKVVRINPDEILDAPFPQDEHGNALEVSVYERLTHFNLTRKIRDIVLARTATPRHLIEDASQEVYATWLSLRALPEFERNQLARYAYLSGQHTVLRLRRRLGAVVVIPEILFRKGTKSLFLDSIGAALNPWDVSTCDNSLELASNKDGARRNGLLGPMFLKERLDGCGLDTVHYDLAYRMLVEKKDVADAAAEMDISLALAERLLNQLELRLRAKDEDPDRAATQIRVKTMVEEDRLLRQAENAAKQAEMPLSARHLHKESVNACT